MWLDGKATYVVRKQTAELQDSVSVGQRLIRFRKKDIPKFFTMYFWDWLECWHMWSDKGLLPLQRSWYEHPHYVIDGLRMFDKLYGQWRAKRRDS